jgi:hypothetical protein
MSSFQIGVTGCLTRVRASNYEGARRTHAEGQEETDTFPNTIDVVGAHPPPTLQLIFHRARLSYRGRHTGNMSGERYLANTSPSKLELHDLDAERVLCQIDEIIRAGHDKPYTTLVAAKVAGYDNCAYCLGGSTR